ncbi:unnamed protein product, partial [marine sediment metagenome]
HALITLKPFPDWVLNVGVKDIKTDFDVVLVAHNHHPWGIKEINGTKFINIGCIGRRKIDEADIEPSVLFINTDTKKLEIIKLKKVKSKEECFDLEKVATKKKFENDIDKFIQELETKEFTGLDLREIAESKGKELGLDKDIIDDLTRRIGGYENEKA